MEKNDKKWINLAQVKLEQELYEQILEWWRIEKFYGKSFTEEEWIEYLKNKHK